MDYGPNLHNPFSPFPSIPSTQFPTPQFNQKIILSIHNHFILSFLYFPFLFPHFPQFSWTQFCQSHSGLCPLQFMFPLPIPTFLFLLPFALRARFSFSHFCPKWLFTLPKLRKANIRNHVDEPIHPQLVYATPKRGGGKKFGKKGQPYSYRGQWGN